MVVMMAHRRGRGARSTRRNTSTTRAPSLLPENERFPRVPSPWRAEPKYSSLLLHVLRVLHILHLVVVVHILSRNERSRRGVAVEPGYGYRAAAAGRQSRFYHPREVRFQPTGFLGTAEKKETGTTAH